MSTGIAHLWGKSCKLAKLLRRGSYRAALRRGRVAAAVEHERLLQSLDCATVVDIGANRGQFALVSRHCFPNARIFSFEPLAKPQDSFRTVLGNDPLVMLYPVAIGEESGKKEMHVSAMDDSSSLLPITPLQSQLYTGTQEVGTEVVTVAKLADYIQPDDIRRRALLKIDVQGFEVQALRGCQPLLREFDFVYVECSFVELYRGQALVDDVIAYLSENRFRLQGVYNLSYDPSGWAIQADLLFVPKAENDVARQVDQLSS
jgi:FkbM family methyltransferase